MWAPDSDTLNAPVAQWIEHWIPNPCAASSILAGGTIYLGGYFTLRIIYS